MNRLSLFISGLILSVTAVACCFSPVSAHEVETDGTISAILHFNNEDNLTSGTPATYTIFVNDSSHHFSLSGCDCTVSIIENGQPIATQSPTHDASGNATGTFTFPKGGSYAITFSGRPLHAGAFQPFTLTYEEQVKQNQSTTLVWLSFGLAIVVIGISSLFYLFSQKEYNKSILTEEE